MTTASTRSSRSSGSRCSSFGLIESQTGHALDADELLPGLLPEGRAAKPTGRNILAAFQGLGLTYTTDGIRLDRLIHTQRHILELLETSPPWPEQGQAPLSNCGNGASGAPFPVSESTRRGWA